MSSKECRDYGECAEISTKRMYILLLNAQEMLLHKQINKDKIIQLLSSIEHDVLLLNDKNNRIRRDLFE